MRSRACRDGQAQYSPRRGPCRFPSSKTWTSHLWPRHPPLGGGRLPALPLILAFAEFGRRFHQSPRRTKHWLFPLLRAPATSRAVRQGSCFSPASRPTGRGWKPHLRKSCDGCGRTSAALPGVRHLAASWRMEGGRGKRQRESCRGLARGWPLFGGMAARGPPGKTGMGRKKGRGGGQTWRKSGEEGGREGSGAGGG